MKRNYIILLAALLTVACAGNGDIMSPTPQEGEILFSGSTVGPKVRTSYEDTETALRVNWVKNDLIGLFAESGGKNLGANFAYKAAVSGATSDFTAASRLNVIRWADETSDHDFYAYYPYTDRAAVDVTAVPVSVPAVQTRSESDPLATLAAHDFLYAVTCGIKKGDNAVNLQFKHLFSALEIRLDDRPAGKPRGRDFPLRLERKCRRYRWKNATVDLRTGEVNVSEAVVSNAVRLDCSGNTSDTEALVLHLVVTPGHAGETFEAVALVNGKEYIFATVKAPSDGGMNWLITRMLPSTSRMDLFITPFSSSKTLNPIIFLHNQSASSCVSASSIPTNIMNPSFIADLHTPSMVTEAWLTR